MPAEPPLAFHLRPEAYVMCRVDEPHQALSPTTDSVLTWLLRDDHGWSAVMPAASVGEGVPTEGPWRALSLKGPFPFTQTGVLSSVLAPLADAGIPILAVSGFDTDHVLVPADEADHACRVLQDAGHTRIDA